jgi:hypothetical protein
MFSRLLIRIFHWFDRKNSTTEQWSTIQAGMRGEVSKESGAYRYKIMAVSQPVGTNIPQGGHSGRSPRTVRATRSGDTPDQVLTKNSRTM